MHYDDDRYDQLATESDAHAEWHRNSGVPMGTPGCPQDACHIDEPPDPDYDAEAEAEARYFAMAPGGDLHGEVRGWDDLDSGAGWGEDDIPF